MVTSEMIQSITQCLPCQLIFMKRMTKFSNGQRKTRPSAPEPRSVYTKIGKLVLCDKHTREAFRVLEKHFGVSEVYL